MNAHGAMMKGSAETARSPRDARPLAVEVVRSFDAGVIDPARWNELVVLSGGTVYQTFEWQSLWWASYGSRRSLHIVLFRADDAVVGIAPLFSRTGRPASSKLFRLIGSGDAFSRSGGLFLDDGPSDYLDLIVAPEYGEAVGRAFVDHVAGNRSSFGRIDLVNLRADGSAMSFIVPALAASTDFRLTITDGDVCSQIDTAPAPKEFLRSLDSGVRRRYTQASRVLEGGDASVTLRTIGPANWDTLYADLVRLHQARWNRAGFPGLFHDKTNSEFQRGVAAALHAQGWLWFAGLYDGERCIAARLGFIFGGRIYDYLSGFDDASPWAKKRPGMALLLRMYEDAHAGGMSALDLLRGDEKYKGELTSDRRILRNVTVEVCGGPPGRKGLPARIGSTAGLAGFLLVREARLFKVHVRQHGLVRGLASYVRFRTQRFTRKFQVGKDSSTNE